ncbi:30S ribosomal protein S9 [Candidatus Bathyarchaeota archaeon]|jgi:small subunit ribosomal protein S9|nr:30S ribosomal protein S9 [Candidatus Bathyarchaeota archaeon]
MSERRRIVLATGKRKTSIATATVKPGKGRVTINGFPLEVYGPEIVRTKIYEPLLVLSDRSKTVDIAVSVRGGGVMGQAEAVRTAIARGISEWSRSAEARRTLTKYDRSMLAGDPRRSEPKKFGGPGARRRKQKSYR